MSRSPGSLESKAPLAPLAICSITLKVPDEGVQRLRANYAGEASNVDYWYGKVIQTVKDLGLYDNTIVVFLSDHGALLNEQGQWVKGPEKIRGQVTHVPLIVHLPKNQYAGKRVSGFVQPADVLPTLLGRLNLKSSARVTGEDLWPYINGDTTNKREYVVSSFGYIAAVRTPEWNYSAVWNKEKFQGSYKPQLYDLKNDPEELKSVADQHPQVVKDLQAKLDELIRANDKARGQFIGIEHLTDEQIEAIRDKIEKDVEGANGKAGTADDSVERLLERY